MSRIKTTILLCFLNLMLLVSCATYKTTEDVAAGYHEVAIQYLKLEEVDKAIEYLEKAIEFNDKLKDTKLTLILAYQEKGEFEKAEQLIVREYKKRRDDYFRKLLLLLGNNYYLQEEFTSAMKVFEEYVKAFPDDHLGFYNLGLIYKKVAEKEEAYKNFLKAYELDNKFSKNIRQIAIYFKQKGDMDNALRYYRELIKTDSKNARAFYDLALLEYDLEDYEAAQAHTEEAVKLDKKEPDYYILLAKIYSTAYNSKEKTLEYIELALENGLKDKKELLGQKEFEKLSKFEAFKGMLEKYFK